MTNIAQVVIPPLHQAYSYAVPLDLSESVTVGVTVEVPLGRRKATGFVVDVGEENNADSTSKYTLKEISDVRFDQRSFSLEQLILFNWVADYYGAPLANVIDVAIPAQVPKKFEKSVSLVKPPEQKLRGSLQQKILAFLESEAGTVSQSLLNKRFKNVNAALKKLEDIGVVKRTNQEVLDQYRNLLQAPEWAKTSVELNDPQTAAVNAVAKSIMDSKFTTSLLHGVTGSGKTEVYIELIQKTLSEGKGALVIVPEIALTPQLVDRFAARLGDNIALLHSGLSKRVRWDSWRALLEGRCQIAIGARSGIFAPINNLGLIIVDEEHDSSYKQSDGLRYNARDIAVVRGSFSNCPVILGSATPSLESFHNALIKKYEYLSIPARHTSGSSLNFELVDLNAVKPWEMPATNVSPKLYNELKDILSRGEQAFILYNRRGFASFLQCETCNSVVECPNCSVTLTYHQGNHSLKCHYCGFSLVPPEFCSSCKPKKGAKEEAPGNLVQRGAGTEKVFDQLQELFPQYVIDRLDRDVVKNQESYETILNKMRTGETKILVGTQMIAKGHDLPGVTLVGVIDCDIGLHMPDFRSSERVYQLLTQASGRAGRGDDPGRIILQTRLPNHMSITKTMEKNFAGFAKAELRNRKDLDYPPYTRMMRILVSSENESAPRLVLESIKESLLKIIAEEQLNVKVLGPTTAPLQKLKTHFRWHVLLKSNSNPQLHRLLNIMKTVSAPKGCKIILDRDPQELL